MLLNYFLMALYSLKRQPVFSAIKVLSLALGLVCSILITLHVQYALSFDKHFPNWENIYRLVMSFTMEDRLDTEFSARAFASQMKLDYPQIGHIAVIRSDRGLFSRGRFARGEDSSYNEFQWAEPDIIQVFSLEFLRGDPGTALAEPRSIVLSQTTARKYFPDEEALGQTLTLNNQVELKVTGVMRDLPDNTHLQIHMMVPVTTGMQLYGETFMDPNNWLGGGDHTYLTLPNPADEQSITNDLPGFLERNTPEQQRTSMQNVDTTLSLQPVADIHLGQRGGLGTGNNRKQVLLVLGAFALMVMITSCVNFANLTLAQMKQRHREIGVRRTLGAKRSQIITQILFESLLMTFAALLLALPAVYLAIPVYNNATGAGFTVETAMKQGTILALVLLVISAGVASGLLPALSVARTEAANVFKGFGTQSRTSNWLRSAMTVLQFGLATFLVILAASIYIQIRHLNTMDPGFDRTNLLVIDTGLNPGAQADESFNYDAMVNEMAQHSGIQALGKSIFLPPEVAGYTSWRRPETPLTEAISISVCHDIVDIGYFDAMKLNLLAGRWFSEEFPTDMFYSSGNTPVPEGESSGSIVITRQAVQDFGFDSPAAALGQMLAGSRLSYRVIGVVEDYYLSGGLEDTQRSVEILQAISVISLPVLLVRIDPAQREAALKHIDDVWRRHRSSVPMNRTFYSQIFNDLVTSKTKGISLAATFTGVITLLVSIMGLYAIASYSTRRRVKEVGIRKVMGARVGRIVRLLTWDFLKPVIFACLLASAAAYLVIARYLEQFSSRAEVSFWLYAIVVAGTMLVASLTVATECYRAASADPVKSLRYE